MESLSKRQQDILLIARNNGSVDVEDLSRNFAVSTQTIRKDLKALCRLQLLERTHGGAQVSSSTENVSYEARRLLGAKAKTKIGQKAATIIKDKSSLIINIGTTTEQVAAALHNHKDLLVISNNINTANIMRKFAGCDVIIAGGIVRGSDGGIMGSATVQFINQFKVDYAIIGTSAIDEEGTLLDYDLREVHVAQAIMANAKHVILVTDAMKLDRSAPIRLGHFSQIDTLVINTPLPPQLAQIAEEHGVKVIIA